MSKSIILEGVDGTGKSSIAQVLSSVFDKRVHRIGGAPKDDADMCRHLDEQLQMAKNGATVLDRTTAISQRVYGDVLGTGFHNEYLEQHIRRILSTGAILVLCETEEICHTTEPHDDARQVQRMLSNIDLIKQTYRDVLDTIGEDYIVYDFRKDPTGEELINNIRDLL